MTTKLQTNHTNVHSINWFFSLHTVQQVRARVQSEGVYYKIGEPVCTYTHKIVGYELVYMCAGPVARVICFRQTHTHIHSAELVHVKRYNFYRDHLIIIIIFIFPEPIWGIVEIPVRPTWRRASGCT